MVVPDGQGGIAHAQLTFGNGMIMLGSSRSTDSDDLIHHPATLGGETQAPYVIVADPDAHCDRARKANARIVTEIADQDYGGRSYGCTDPEGHLWYFGSYDPWAEE